jgi:hypothetical protein
MALSKPEDIMKLTLREEPGIVIRHDDEYKLPAEPEKMWQAPHCWHW